MKFYCLENKGISKIHFMIMMLAYMRAEEADSV